MCWAWVPGFTFLSDKRFNWAADLNHGLALTTDGFKCPANNIVRIVLRNVRIIYLCLV